MNLLPNTYLDIEMTIMTLCMTNVAGISVEKPQRDGLPILRQTL